MEQYRIRLIVGAAMMGLGFAAQAVMLSGLVLSERPPAWFWGMILWLGAGTTAIFSAFVAAARDRRQRSRDFSAANPPADPRD